MEFPYAAPAAEQPASDEALMQRYAAEGDGHAFDQLFQRHKSTVYAFIYKFIQAPDLADDLFQNVFLRVIRHRSHYQPNAKFSTWLYTITRSVCIDALRRMKKTNLERSVPSDEPSADGLMLLASGDPSPREQLHEMELQEKIDAVLLTLPPEQREVLLWREMTELTFAEIGEITGCPANTVKSRMHYALLALRRGLQEKGITSP